MNIAATVVFLLLSILARSQECNIDPHYCDPAVEVAREEAERAYHEQIENVRSEVKADRDNALKTCQMKLSMRLSEVNQDDDKTMLQEELNILKKDLEISKQETEDALVSAREYQKEIASLHEYLQQVENMIHKKIP